MHTSLLGCIWSFSGQSGWIKSGPRYRPDRYPLMLCHWVHPPCENEAYNRVASEEFDIPLQNCRRRIS